MAMTSQQAENRSMWPPPQKELDTSELRDVIASLNDDYWSRVVLEKAGAYDSLMNHTSWMNPSPHVTAVKDRCSYVMAGSPSPPKCPVCNESPQQWKGAGFTGYCSHTCKARDQDKTYWGKSAPTKSHIDVHAKMMSTVARNIGLSVPADPPLTCDEVKDILVNYHIHDNTAKRSKGVLEAIGLWSHIMRVTSWMPDNLPRYREVADRISYICSSNRPDTIPLCPECHSKPLAWRRDLDRFGQFCSSKCQGKSQRIKDTISKANRDNAKSRCEKMVATRHSAFLAKGSNPYNDAVGQKIVASTLMNNGPQFYSDQFERQKLEHGGIHPIEEPSVHLHQSKAEFEIIDRLVAVGVPAESIIHGDRKLLDGREIDIYIPDKHIGIEFNGEVWHSSKFRSSRDMYDKYADAKSKGVQIINVFSREWDTHPNQIINLLQSKLIHPAVRVMARKCTVSAIDQHVARQFIESNHIQGIGLAATHNYGIIHDDQLLAVMAFGIHHRNSRDMCLRRFCCLPGVQIIGGASKLLKHAADANDWRRIVSWSDNRWSDGGLYESIGFKLTAESKPDYFYIAPDNRTWLSKQSCKKSKIGARPGQTELERATELGLYRVYDCGKKTWLWTR